MSEAEILLAKALILLSDKEEQNLSHEFSTFALALEHYLQTHISDPINLDEIANYFHISKSTLCRKTKQLMGKTVCQLAENIKIDWAKMLLTLKDSPLNVSEIALRVGYSDALYFSRIFKKHIGLSPNNWRKIHFQQSSSVSVRKKDSS